MAEKVETLRRLLHEGYQIDTVATDHSVLEARLVRGGSRVVLKLDARDAAALLRDPRPLP